VQRLPLDLLDAQGGAQEVLALARSMPLALTLRHPMTDEGGVLRQEVIVCFERGRDDAEAHPQEALFGDGETGRLPSGASIARRALALGAPQRVTLPDGLLSFIPGRAAYAPVEEALDEMREGELRVQMEAARERLRGATGRAVPLAFERLEEALGDVPDESREDVTRVLDALFKIGYNEGTSEFAAQMIEQGGQVQIRHSQPED
jgi:hypothetical protein